MRNTFFYFLLTSLICACTNDSSTEKTQNSRNNIINVKSKVKEIIIEDVLIGSISPLYLVNEYLLIEDVKSMDKLIHVFDKHSFSYITSTGYKGEGPNEIANIGHVAANEKEREFYVSDHGKLAIYSYKIDSVLVNPFYEHKLKLRLNNTLFPANYQYINDTLCIGRIIRPIGNADFQPSVGKWNMLTGEIQEMKYRHPDIQKKRILCDVSIKDGIYVECYENRDLMTICDLNGNLKYNIYGENWNMKVKTIQHYGNVKFTNDGILALYSGDKIISPITKQVNSPTKFLYFNKRGDYICTFETGYNINYFCYDKDKNRVIMTLDSDIQFGYLDLNELINN